MFSPGAKVASPHPTPPTQSQATPDLKNSKTFKTEELTTSADFSSQTTGSDQSNTMASFQSSKDRLGRNNRTDNSRSWRRHAPAGEEDVPVGSPVNPSDLVLSKFGGEHTIHVSSVSPGPVYPTKNQLLVATGYGIRLKDGTYTRLIRSDELQQFNIGFPASQHGPEGLIILPATELRPHSELDGPFQYVTGAFVSSLPKDRPNHHVSNFSFVGTGYCDDVKAKAQREIDSIVAKNPVAAMNSPLSVGKVAPRRKVYCDKWLHDGTCAFTQLGCKYKHEMPMDKATQTSLGLNHGIPLWYRKANAVQLRPGFDGNPQPSNTAGPWRRQDGYGISMGRGVSSSPAPGLNNGIPLSFGRGTSSSPALIPYGRQNFGPIGRPVQPKFPQQVKSDNPFALLPLDGDLTMGDGDDEEGEITFSGRPH